MTRIGPDGPPPDLPALIRTLRSALSDAAARASEVAARVDASARAQGAAALTRATRMDPLTELFADGPGAGRRGVLPALREVLRASVDASGGLDRVVGRLVEELSRLAPPPTAGGSEGAMTGSRQAGWPGGSSGAAGPGPAGSGAAGPGAAASAQAGTGWVTAGVSPAAPGAAAPPTPGARAAVGSGTPDTTEPGAAAPGSSTAATEPRTASPHGPGSPPASGSPPGPTAPPSPTASPSPSSPLSPSSPPGPGPAGSGTTPSPATAPPMPGPPPPTSAGSTAPPGAPPWLGGAVPGRPIPDPDPGAPQATPTTETRPTAAPTNPTAPAPPTGPTFPTAPASPNPPATPSGSASPNQSTPPSGPPAPGPDPPGQRPTEPTPPQPPSTPGAPAQDHPAAQLRTLLPTTQPARTELLTSALTWLMDSLDRPDVLAAGCAQLGPTLGALGVPPQRLDALALLLLDALRTTGLGAGHPDHLDAWHATGRLVARWMAQAATAAQYEPPYWTGTVTEHDRRRQDLAVVRVRTFLPYPYLPGQYATVESAHHRERWRPCWIGNPPAPDNTVELHVRAGEGDEVGLAVVGRIGVGDRLRLGAATGAGPVLGRGGGLLLVAEDTGVAPMKALLAALRAARDHRPVHLLWMVAPNEEPYDRAAVEAAAGPERPVLLAHGVTGLTALLAARGPWTDRDAFVAGAPTGMAAALTALAYAGVAPTRVRHTAIDG